MLHARRLPAGRGLPLIIRVVSKTHLVLSLPDGQRVNTGQLSVVMRKVGGRYQFRVVQKVVGGFVVRVVPMAVWSDGHAERVREHIRDFGGRSVGVTAILVPRIDRLAGRKSADVISGWAGPDGPASPSGPEMAG